MRAFRHEHLRRWVGVLFVIAVPAVFAVLLLVHVNLTDASLVLIGCLALGIPVLTEWEFRAQDHKDKTRRR